MAAVTGERLLLPLTCGVCGRTLEGGHEALVYLCPTCRKATVMGPSPKAYDLAYVRARAPLQGPRVYVPFWLLEGEASWRTDDRTKNRVYGNARRLGALAFPAFWSPRAAYHDNLTVRYALEAEPFEFEAREDPVLDGVRAPDVLPELARLTWLAYLDRLADVTGVELEFHARSLCYAAVPFFRAGDRLADGVLGVEFPAGLFSEE